MDDTISRKAAIDAFDTDLNKLVIGGAENAKAVVVYLNTVIDRIKSLPPTQPKRGKWTADNACSECGCQPWYSRDIHIYKFCPNCGADMREETEQAL